MCSGVRVFAFVVFFLCVASVYTIHYITRVRSHIVIGCKFTNFFP